MKNLINCLSVSSNSLILALIALILVLIILIIILIIKSNNKPNYSFLDEEVTTSIKDLKLDGNNDMNKISNNEIEIATKVELPKENSIKQKFNLDEVTKQMQNDIDNENINLTEFEIEQEEKSIISYKELLEKVNKDKIISNNISINTPSSNTNSTKSNEYSFNTEVLDFESDIKEELAKKNIKNEQYKTILSIDEDETSHENFLNSLKTLKDNLG